MTQIVLPNTSVTGANLWSQVEDNDQAIVDVVNGDIGADNLAPAAVTTAKIANDAVTGAKIADSTTDGGTVAAGNTGSFFLRKYADGLVLLSATLQKDSGSWVTGASLGTLPAGFRPAGTVAIIGFGFLGGVAVEVYVASTGAVTFENPTATVSQLSIGGAAFHAA